MRPPTLLKERTPLLVVRVVLIAMLGVHVVLRDEGRTSARGREQASPCSPPSTRPA